MTGIFQRAFIAEEQSGPLNGVVGVSSGFHISQQEAHSP